MRIAFFVVLLCIAFLSAMDVMFGDTSKKEDTNTVAGALGLKPARRHQESVALFLIAVIAMSVLLIVEALA